MKLRSLSLLSFLLILLALGVVIVGCAQQTHIPTGLIEDVNVQEAFSLIQDNKDNPDLVIIDVRTPAEFADGHVANAINIDFNSGAFREEISKLDKDKNYLIYCRSGNRSRGAIDLMKELQFQEIYHMYQGMIGWTNGGYPTVK